MVLPSFPLLLQQVFFAHCAGSPGTTKQHAGDFPLRCLWSQLCCSISRAAGLGWKPRAHGPWLPAQGEYGEMFEGQKSTFALNFHLTGLHYSCRYFAFKTSFFVVSCFVQPLCIGVASMASLHIKYSVPPPLSLSLQYSQYPQPLSLPTIQQPFQP